MLPSYDGNDNYSTVDETGNRLPGAIGGRRIEGWLEPAWRSDRMCWMLLSTAMGLSYELVVFDDIEELIVSLVTMRTWPALLLTCFRPMVEKSLDLSIKTKDTS